MWKKHPIYSDYYANENGEIMSINYRKKHIKKIIKQTKLKNGYLIVSINGNSISSHRFIWECFNGLLENGLTIDHINTLRNDNRIENLKKCTQCENNRNKLTIQHLREIKSRLYGKKVLKLDKKSKEIICWYPSISEAARKNNITPKYIRWVCENRNGYYTVDINGNIRMNFIHVNGENGGLQNVIIVFMIMMLKQFQMNLTMMKN